jgi:branched-chain amino acid transport system permease protein
VGSELLQFVVAGLKSGAIYALIALGFTLVYASTGIINFAQGEFYMLGGMISVYFFDSLGVPLFGAVVLGVVSTVAIGAAIERFALRPRRDEPPLVLIIITIGVSMVLQSAARHVFGPDEVTLPPFTDRPSVMLFGAAIEWQTVWVWGITIVAVAALTFLYRKTRFGLAMRATSISHEASRLMGIDTALVVMVAFAMAAGLGALGGVAVTPLTQMSFDAGARIGLKGFAAAILGGMGNPVGAVVGGLLLGLIENLSIAAISSTYKDAIALIVLLAVLFIRPSGLLGRPEKEKI